MHEGEDLELKGRNLLGSTARSFGLNDLAHIVRDNIQAKSLNWTTSAPNGKKIRNKSWKSKESPGFFLAGLDFLFISTIGSLPFSLLPFSSVIASASPFTSRSRYPSLRFHYTSSLLSAFAFTASSTRDPLGASLPLSSLASASLFLLYSLSGLLSLPPVLALPLPSSFLDLLAIFSFSLEFIYFYLRRKDLDRIKNQYFDLLLVPICMYSSSEFYCRKER